MAMRVAYDPGETFTLPVIVFLLSSLDIFSFMLEERFGPRMGSRPSSRKMRGGESAEPSRVGAVSSQICQS
ncbi:hypothetical protein HPP92_008124 [Vanilla planifolia]|uniref:Uncharacterized protein n=1 Tax=Vanilla planifolia TaxID=51239 RepID=A0A835RF53_VANPL|nr:hypothetical protein HPP92_008124 [Vanilla planifolia]